MTGAEGDEDLPACGVALVVVAEGVARAVNRANEADPDAPVCYFVGRRKGGRPSLASERTGDGTRAVLVSEDEAAAQAFLIIEGLGWQAVGHGRREAAAFQESASPRA